LGKELLSTLMSARFEDAPADLTLGSLWERFSTENPQWLDNKEAGRADDARSATLLLAFFGADRVVSTLDQNDQRNYAKARELGRIVLPSGLPTTPVRIRTVQADLVLLHAMLRWASRSKASSGELLLVRNPLDGVRIEGESNSVRPIASRDRFEATLAAIVRLRGAASTDREKARWVKVGLALCFAEATGRRLNSIRNLQWQDINLDKSEIHWRAEHDKKGHDSVIPMTTSLQEAVVRAKGDLKSTSAYVFASETDPTHPMDRHLFDKWLTVAEKEAELPKLIGGLWHPYRRKWATERKHHPLKDVMAAGGWSDAETLIRSYQQADRETLLRVMNEPNPLRDSVTQAA
jgi:integrase